MSDERTPLGQIGVWSLELRFGDPALSAIAAAELEELGYSAVWLPGGVGGDVTGSLDRLLDASTRLTVIDWVA